MFCSSWTAVHAFCSRREPVAIVRSEGMVKVAYFVFRYSGQNVVPEEFQNIGLNTRKSVFEACFDALHNGRSLSRFLTSMEGDFEGYRRKAKNVKRHPQRRFLKDFIPPHDRRKQLWNEIQRYFPETATPSPSRSTATWDRQAFALPPTIPVMDVDDEGFEDDAECEIQNLTREVQVRQKQSLFRKRVMENFDGRCCLSGITEPCLLVASHIVPWAASSGKRLNPRNGILLNAIFDKLFDRGLMTFDDDLSVIVIDWIDQCSPPLKKLLSGIDGQEAAQPKKLPRAEFLAYHREFVFKRNPDSDVLMSET